MENPDLVINMGKIEPSNRRILITGAAGFIGSALCERLVQRGWNVLGIDNLNKYYDVRLKEARLFRLGFNFEEKIVSENTRVSLRFPNLSFIKGDITDLKLMQSVFHSFRPMEVVNLAAQAGVRYSIENPFSYAVNNIDGFLVLLECMRHNPVRKFIYASSSSVYGSNTKIPFSESDATDNPVSLYAATKKSNELMARAYKELYGVPSIGLRFFTVYGPWGRPDMAPMLFAKAIRSGSPIKVFNEGNLSRDFTYIDDIIDGIVKVIEKESPEISNDIYNIGHGSPVKLMDFIKCVEKCMGRTAEKIYLPMQKGDVVTTYADTSLLKKDFDYAPSTALNEGIAKFVEWYDSNENPLK